MPYRVSQRRGCRCDIASMTGDNCLAIALDRVRIDRASRRTQIIRHRSASECFEQKAPRRDGQQGHASNRGTEQHHEHDQHDQGPKARQKRSTSIATDDGSVTIKGVPSAEATARSQLARTARGRQLWLGRGRGQRVWWIGGGHGRRTRPDVANPQRSNSLSERTAHIVCAVMVKRTPVTSPTSETPAPETRVFGASPSGVETATTQSTVSAPDQLDQAPARRSMASVLGWTLCGLLVIAVIAAALIRLPYYRLEPGSVYETAELVEVGGDQRVYVPEGDVAFVTVSQTPDITIFEWLDAKLDDNVQIEHEDVIRGDQTADEKRDRDQRRMQLSKSSAVVVALQRLGFEPTFTPLGVEVAGVFDCTGADGVLNTGDLILGANGSEVLETTDLLDVLSQLSIGDPVDLMVGRLDPTNIARSSGTELVRVNLGSADDACLIDDVRADEARPFIGISTSNYASEELPFDVSIDTGRVGGPSAGLAFTLSILDVLTEGELTGGLDVVATGTIDREGGVGAVGGVRHKVVAAERSGADLFLVPLCCDNWVDPATGEPLDLPSNYEEALEYADEIKVVGVATLDDALRAIGEAGGDVSPFFDESGSVAGATEEAAGAPNVDGDADVVGADDPAADPTVDTSDDVELEDVPEPASEDGGNGGSEDDVDSGETGRRGERQDG